MVICAAVTLLVTMGMLLFEQSQAGVPLTCAVILPLLIAAVEAHGSSDKLHSQQSHVPVETMKEVGLKKEKGRLFMTK